MTYGLVGTRARSVIAGWNSVATGGGGFVSGINVTVNSGGATTSKYIRLDGGQAYKFNNTTNVWDSVLTRTSMPSTDVGVGGSPHKYLCGQYEICAAPSDNTRVYMAYNSSAQGGYVFVSNDSGGTWTRTAGWPSSGIPMQSNANDKYYGPKMAVDPVNKDVVYIGTPPQTCTITVSSATVSCAGNSVGNNGNPGGVHGLTTNDKIQFGNVGGALPTGIAAETTYFVIATGLTTTAFQFSATQGGSAITPSGSTSGTNYVSRGALVTIDGGTNWTTVPNVPFAFPGTSGVYAVSSYGFAFDPTSGTQANTGGTGSKTTGIYMTTNGYGSGKGVYKSSNGGTSFSALASSPDNNGMGVIGLDGAYYVASIDGNTVYRYMSSTWTNITPTYGFTTSWIVPSLFNAGTIIAVHPGGALQLSNNNGTTWGTGVSTHTTVATDVPWLAVNNSYQSVNSAVMDPLTDGKIWFGSGVGPCYVQLTGSGASLGIPASIPFVMDTKGVQELVNSTIISPVGGGVWAVNQDRPLMNYSSPTVYPSTYYPTYASANIGNPIAYAFDADWASSDPNYIAVLANLQREDSGYSADGGTTWSRFAVNQSAQTTGAIGGSIAIASPNYQLICQANRGDVWYTTDGWATVSTKITAAAWNSGGATGMQNADAGRTIDTGWPFAYYLRVKSVCADRVASNTFYAVNSNSNAAGGGIYRVSFPAGVLTIARMGNYPANAFGANARMLAVPNYSGSGTITTHLWLHAGEGNATALWRSNNGGTSWTAVQSTGEIWCMGFGANKPGTNHPAVYAVGTIGGVFGVYRGDNDISVWDTNTSVVWTLLSTDLPLGSTDIPTGISGSDTYGRCWLGFGSQMLYYRP